MKIRPLRRRDGGIAAEVIVDDGDYEWLSKRKWHLSKSGYAAGRKNNQVCVYMHREINQTPDGLFTDHIDGDPLNNRRSNLRTCTASGSTFNRRSTTNTSGYKGVAWSKACKKWSAQIMVGYRKIHLGVYENIEDAAKVYQAAALKYHGEFANTGVASQ